ncbi:MAG TPA: HD domain-containing phosphohydrolase [Cellvibrio sp.]|nr:HD domain-containing phosphohydrolase [Cellvibrio sp.]
MNELSLGMYISGLDRPWSQTPFPLQGFYLRDLDDLNKLKSLCNFVYIDTEKGRGPISSRLIRRDHPSLIAKAAVREPMGASLSEPVAPLKIQRNLYHEIIPLQKEIKKARLLYLQINAAVADISKQFEYLPPEDIALHDAQKLVGEMVDSIVRNPDAFTWLSRLQAKDVYLYSHVIRSAVWATLFGRHIGLPKRDLDVLAMGLLLKDVGRMKIDAAILAKRNRTVAEEQTYEHFIELGADILRKMPGVEPRVISVVKTHCERLNGSGFPLHLAGDKIPLLGKIAGIVTFYDQITNPRGSRNPIAPSKAVAKLYELRNIQFQEELVVEFIRAIGLYPTGTLVELNSGEVGVVVEQNFERRLKPKVVVVYDAFKRKLNDFVLLDLSIDDKHKQALIDAGKKTRYEIEKIEIARDLEPGSIDIDIDSIRDKYLTHPEKTGLRALLSKFTS